MLLDRASDNPAPTRAARPPGGSGRESPIAIHVVAPRSAVNPLTITVVVTGMSRVRIGGSKYVGSRTKRTRSRYLQNVESPFLLAIPKTQHPYNDTIRAAIVLRPCIYRLSAILFSISQVPYSFWHQH